MSETTKKMVIFRVYVNLPEGNMLGIAKLGDNLRKMYGLT